MAWLSSVPALAVVLGANVGSTLIVQLLSFDGASIAPAFVLIGVLMFRRASAGPRDLGRVLIGLGLMLLALRQVLDVVTPFEDAPNLRILLGAVATQPVLDVILAAGLTWAAHSSVAIVLLVISLAKSGAVPPAAAFALVLGANLGTAINPCLEGGVGDDPAARRLPVGNLLNRVIGVMAALALLTPIGRLMVTIEPENARAVADFHTAFNVIVAAVFMPLLSPFSALLKRLLPPRVEPGDPARPLHLDPAARETPFVALGGAAREALRLADVLEAMLTGLRDALEHDDRRRVAASWRLDNVLDKLNTAIKAYLGTLDPEAMSETDHRRVAHIFVFATNMEHAGDVVDKNLLGLASKRIKRGIAFSREQRTELLGLIDKLLVNLRTAAAVFITGDLRAARMLVAEKEALRDIEARVAAAHLDDVRAGLIDTTESSTLYLDILRDLKRAHTHIVAAAAYPVLENAGELLPSRLRQVRVDADE